MGGHVTIRFHEELNDFLPPERRGLAFIHGFNHAGSVKELIESLGVPHPEVDAIEVDGRCVDFAYRVRDGDSIAVHPRLATAPPALRLRPARPQVPRFVLDGHLGRLAAYLRLLGFDTLYRTDFDDPELARITDEEERILLTCDRGLLMRARVRLGYFVRERRPRRQLEEVVTRMGLTDAMHPFTRCMACNGPIAPAEKSAVSSHLPPRIHARHDRFWRCAACGRVYWKGSHYDRLRRIVADTGTSG